MSGKLIITKKNEHFITAMYEKDKMVEISLEPIKKESILHHIYIGKVKNIVKNINAAFLEIAGGILCYYSLDQNPIHNFVNPKKNNILQVGDELLVQVEKEAIKKKAPTVSSNINLSGKYVVLTSSKQNIGISNKIEDLEEKKRLKHLVEEYRNPDFGVIIRTNAAYIRSELLKKELLILTEQMEQLFLRAPYLSCFSLVKKAPAAYLSEIKDQNEQHLEQIVTDDPEIYEEIKDYLIIYQPMDLAKLMFHPSTSLPLWTLYGMQKQLEEAKNERVWLKSGSYLIIQPTEAMVVIDVNTGKSIGKKQSEKHFFHVNIEAAKEVARQIRLRNLSGIILVDFIDMQLKEHNEMLLKELQILFKEDRIKTDLIDMTKLGLVEITRKKVKKPLYEQLPNFIKEEQQ